MASEPFRRVGRGGAGNFHWQDGVDGEVTRDEVTSFLPFYITK